MKREHSETFLLTATCFAFAFLYIPILLLIVYSFNASKLVTIWGGFSTKWYGELLRNELILNSAWLSLKIAIVSSTFATAMGTLAGIAITRYRRFKGRTLFSGLITAPMVMPEVITGLSLLLMFISLEATIGWPNGRGFSTITIAHITFSMAYVTVIVQSRLKGMNQALEEAAIDLGARPMRVMFDITLPLLMPAMISGWLLAFTLSIDDLVIASFVSGPGSSTLPMVIFSKIKLGVTPDINALATLVILIVTLGVGIAGYVMHRDAKNKAG